MPAASGEARKRQASAKSSGVTSRPSGTRPGHRRRAAGLAVVRPRGGLGRQPALGRRCSPGPSGAPLDREAWWPGGAGPLARAVTRRSPATAPGVPLTLPIMMIRAALGPALHHRVGGLGDVQRRDQVQLDDLGVQPGGRGWRAAAAGDPPALLTTTSTRPKRSAASPMSRWACTGSLTSARVKTAMRPSVPGSEAASDGSVRPHTSTCAPASRNARADARPDAAGAPRDDHRPAPRNRRRAWGNMLGLPTKQTLGRIAPRRARAAGRATGDGGPPALSNHATPPPPKDGSPPRGA